MASQKKAVPNVQYVTFFGGLGDGRGGKIHSR